MDQKELIKALVKVLREDIKKTLKEEIRKAVHEVLNEQVETPKQKVNEGYQMKSKDDGSWGTIDYSQRAAAPARPMISPDMLGYGDGFDSYMQPEPTPSWGGGNEEYGSYMQAQQEEQGIPLHVKAQIAAQRNPQAAAPVLKALNRDYSQLVKKFNKG